MGAKFPIIIMFTALAVLGGGIVMMGQMGSDDPDSGGNTGTRTEEKKGKHADSPLTATATFNVSKKLDSGVNLITEIASVADELNAVGNDPTEDLQIVDEIIQFHSRLFKTVPGGGENVDIMRKLMGGNERQVALIDPEHPAINERGELVDRWGTPFHFHQLSSKKLEVRSAGPDLSLYTEDDVLMEDDEDGTSSQGES